MREKILYKIRGAFQSLGIGLKKFHCYYEFEYNHIMMLLQIDEEEQSISFVTFVVDSSDGGMNEQTLKTALSIVSNTHEYYSGDWNDGFPYFISPAYYIEDSNDVSAGWLQEQLKAFVDAYLFLEANIHMLCDSSLWGLDMKADGNDKNIEGD